MTTVRVVEADYADPTHRDGIVHIIDSYASEPIGGGTSLAPEVRERLPDALRDHPTARVLLAIDSDGRPVGVAACFLGLSTFQARPLLNIHDLAVLPEWRGRGVGRALLEGVEALARSEGCGKLTLEVLEENERARGLYASFGFSDYAPGSSTPTRFLSKPLD